jgi:arylsulfatase A-like enzyme
LFGHCADRSGDEALVCWSLDEERSGEIYYGPAPDSVVMNPPFEPASHGSLNEDDRFVPLVLWGPGVAPGTSLDRPSMLRIAPTLAKLLGIPPPSHAREPALL